MYLFAGALLFCATTAFAQPVSVPDPALLAGFRAALNKPEGEITRQDLESLETFQTVNSSIKDLTGLDFALNLRKLVLRQNQITSIAQLATLTNLESLNLGINEIADISPLEDLVQLAGLSLLF